MFSRPFSTKSPRARRFITGLALLAYVASVVGYPLPLPAAVEQDDRTPFPCQGHACGCNSAQQCWESCCCYTPAERLAWIRQHDVSVPAATLQALNAAAAEEAPATKSCCHRTQDHLADDGCGDDCQHDHDPAHPAPQGEHRSGIVWVNGIQAQKCQGLTTLWLVSGANLPLEILPLWDFDWVVVDRVAVVSEAIDSPAYQPSVPPPCRRAA